MIALPATVDRDALFEPWTVTERYQGEWTPAIEVNGQFRRDVTRWSPVRFALVYLPHLLRSPETGNVSSLAEHHFAMAKAAAKWSRPGACRDAWVAPRGAAKTTWTVILVLWALCHGHRRFFGWLSDSSDQARLAMATFRNEVGSNGVLLRDFPDMAPPRIGTRGARDSQDTYTARGGAIFAVRGMNTRMLGLNIGGKRPDGLVCDDIEPDASNYSVAARKKRLETLLNTVLPMNEQAAVVLMGTVTMYDSIMHAVARKARREGRQEQWIDDEHFTVHYVPAIQEDPATGVRRSFWPQRYALGYLERIEHTLNYLLNFAGWPPLPGGHNWKPETFRYGGLEWLDGKPLVMQIDPAPTADPTSDYTALVVGGLVPASLAIPKARAVILHGSKFRTTPGQLAERVKRHLAANPAIRKVRVEGNQGSALWIGVIEPILPPGVELEVHAAGRMSKMDRIARALYFAEEEQVWHSQRLPETETDLQMWGSLALVHDDLPDAYAHLVRHLLEPFEDE